MTNENVDASLKTVAKGAMFIFIGVFFSKALTYVYRLIMARFLGPEEYGLFSLAFSVFMVAMLFSKFGVPVGINRFVSKYIGREDSSRIRGVIWAALEITLPVSLLLSGILFLLAPFIGTAVLNEPGTIPLIRIFAIAIPLRTFLVDLVAVFKAFKRMDYFAAVDHILQSIVLVGLTAALVYSGYGVIGAAAAYAASILVAAAAALYLVQNHVFPVVGGPVHRNHRELLTYSIPLLGTGMIGAVTGHVDNFMLAWFPNTAAADVGIYNAALPTGHLIGAFGMMFGVILFPVITAHLARGERTEALNITSATIRWTTAVAFPATLLLVLFSGPVLRVLFGPVYVQGQFVLSLIAVAAFLGVVVTPVTKYLPAQDKTTWMLVNTLASAGINVPLNYILIPIYGIAGAGIATTVSLIIGSLLAVFEAVVFLHVRPSLRGTLVPVVASGTAAATVYLLLKTVFPIIPGWALIPGGILFLFIYAALFLLLGGLRHEDVIVLQAIERRTDMNLEPLKRIVRRLSRA